MNKYLVTGGSGFIGTNIVQHHIDRGDEILNIDIEPPKDISHNQYWKKCDILDANALSKTIKAYCPTHVYHMAARTDLNGNSIEDYAANTVGVKNIINALQDINELKNVVFASSRLVCKIDYEPKNWDDYLPTTAYGASKVEGEKIVKAIPETKWTWSIVRPTSIWGPWFGVPYRNFFDSIHKGLYLHPSGKKIYKSFGFVGNSVYQLFQLMHAPKHLIHRNCFYIGDYEPIEVYSFANLIAKSFNKGKVPSVPLGLLKAPALLGDGLGKIGVQFPLTTFRLNNLTTPMLHKFDNLEMVVGKLPFSIEEGTKITTDWMKNRA